MILYLWVHAGAQALNNYIKATIFFSDSFRKSKVWDLEPCLNPISPFGPTHRSSQKRHPQGMEKLSGPSVEQMKMEESNKPISEK